MANQKQYRTVIERIDARPASDGAGVNLMRVFGGRHPERFDPFLMLDEFGSDKADDYIAGFPPHPHRGFETITYMLEGKMEHRDHLGNVGLLSDGGVQWMTAGRGVIHSEMPKQTEGKMRGFQLWLNLPAATKMQPARYEDVAAAAIPKVDIDGVAVIAVAGDGEFNGHALSGYFDVPDTHAQYFDVHLPAGQTLDVASRLGHTALVYVYDGELVLGQASPATIRAQQIARLSDGDRVAFANTSDVEARFLMLSGKPIGEPIKQYGPFVMNTEAELEQAISDYRAGTLVEAG